MSEFPAEMLSSSHVPLNGNPLFIYLLLRGAQDNDIFLTEQKLALLTGLLPMTVGRAITTIVGVGLCDKSPTGKIILKESHKDIFSDLCNSKAAFYSIPLAECSRQQDPGPSEEQKRMVREQKLRLSGLVSLDAGLGGPPRKKTGKDVFEYFLQIYQKEYATYPSVDRRTGLLYSKRILEWCGNNFDDVCKVLQYMIDHWGDLRSRLSIQQRFPTPFVYGTSKHWYRIREAFEGRLPETTKRRSQASAAPDSGW